MKDRHEVYGSIRDYEDKAIDVYVKHEFTCAMDGRNDPIELALVSPMIYVSLHGLTTRSLRNLIVFLSEACAQMEEEEKEGV